MPKDVSQLTDEERAKLFPVILEEHNPQWKIWYEEEKETILSFAHGIKKIYHYGSTSIPSIIAKPTIDILVDVDESADLNVIQSAFIKNQYNFMNYGRPPSMMFVKGYTPLGFAEKVFHVHVIYSNGAIPDEILFRDYLIANPHIAKEYEKLKVSLKEKYTYDRDGYTDAKADFIKKTTGIAIKKQEGRNEHRKR